MPAKSVLCVEAQAEIQDAFRKTLTSMGYRVLLVADAERAAERFRESPVDAVIFDTDGQDAESIEAFLDMHEKAHEEGQQLVGAGLARPAGRTPSGRSCPPTTSSSSSSKPIKMKQVQDALMPARAHSIERIDAGGSTCSPVSLVLSLFLAIVDRHERRACRPTTPEARAVAFLSREVPRWSRENHCFSCHNNGDAARALVSGVTRGLSRVPTRRLADTTGWLLRPAGWDHNGGDGPFSDKRLARVVFTAALATAIATGWVRDRSVLVRAAERLVLDQAADGSWPLEERTTQARRRPTAVRWPRSWRARAWSRPTRPGSGPPSSEPTAGSRAGRSLTVTDASVCLMVVHGAAAGRRRRATASGASSCCARASPTTAAGGLRSRRPPSRSTPRSFCSAWRNASARRRSARMIARGRGFLIAQQQETEAGSRRPGRRATSATPSESRPPAGPRWRCWRPSEPQRCARDRSETVARLVSACDPFRDRAGEIHLERSGHAVSRQVFQLGSDRRDDSRPLSTGLAA